MRRCARAACCSCSPAAARSPTVREQDVIVVQRRRRADAHGARPAVARRADRHRADRLRHPRAGVRPVLDASSRAATSDAAKQTGAAVSYRAPDSFSIERMKRYLDVAIADHPDGLVVSLPDVEALRPVDREGGQGGHPGDHDQLRRGRVQVARRARPRRPARVRGGRQERRAARRGGRPQRAVRQPGVGQRRARRALPRAARRAQQGRRRACARSRSRCRTRRPRSGGWPPRSPAGRIDGILTLGPGGAAPAIAADQRQRHDAAGSRSRRSTSAPTCWPACATARSSSPSTSSPTCRASCRSCCSSELTLHKVFPGQGELIPTGPQFVTKAERGRGHPAQRRGDPLARRSRRTSPA